MAQIFFIQYEVRPSQQSEHYAAVGGAFANCFVVAESSADAEKLALQNFADNHWEVVAVEETPSPTTRESYSDGEWLEWYDQAVQDGECYVFHQWSNEAQENDQVQ